MIDVQTTTSKRKINPNRGPRPTPTGLRPQQYASDVYDEAIDVADEAEPVNETEPVRERSRSPEYDVANSTVHGLRCADRGAGNDQALVRMRDTEFGCGSLCHIRVRAVRCAFGGHQGEALGSHFRGQGFKSGSCSRCRADDIDVKVCDDLRCRVSVGGALEGALER
jgi:hypothetical protein